MTLRDRLSAVRVADSSSRAQALEVLARTYRDEKGWVANEDQQLPRADLERTEISWFVVRDREQPIAVMRVMYDPPLALYEKYGFQLIEGVGGNATTGEPPPAIPVAAPRVSVAPGIDVAAFLRDHRIAEVGRFAVLPDYRKHIVVVAALMRAAMAEVVRRRYSHLITDVFEDDPHSPYQFHTRVMGFEPVATHEIGELNCASRRITLILDLKHAYRRLSAANGFIFRFITGEWEDDLHRQLAG